MILQNMNSQIGIVLSGGGARGVAHAGVLSALEENGVSPQYISGSSMGAIIGALYAAGKTPNEIRELFRHVKLLNLFRLKRPFLGLTDMHFLRKIILKTLGKPQIEDLPRKLFICVSNLQTGEYEIFDSGDLTEIVVASASIPMVFRPVEYQGRIYSDGGLINNLPVEPLIDKVKTIIGVSVVNRGIVHEPLDSFWDIAERSFSLSSYQNVKPRLKYCDIIIEPKDVTLHSIFAFKNAQEIFEKGYTTAMDSIPDLLRVLGMKHATLQENKMRNILGDGR